MDENQELEERSAQLTQDLGENNIQAFRNSLLEMHIYEQGQFYQSLIKENRQLVYSYLSPRELADMLDVIEEDNEHMKKYLDEMRPSYAAGMLSEMYIDGTVDLLDTLDKRQIAKYLSLMSADDAGEIKEFLHYEGETADVIMIIELVSIVANQTIRPAMYVLENEADVARTIYYIYVVSQGGQLVGVTSLRDLVVDDDGAMISDLMSERAFSVRVGDDQEDVAQTFRNCDLLTLSATDYDDHLLGIVIVDDITDVAGDETVSDYPGPAGVNVEEINENPVKVVSRRLPWLVTLLFSGMPTASLISHYEDLVNEASILAAFISLITGTAGSAGIQLLAVTIRRLAVSDEKSHRFVRLVPVEVLTDVITGAVTRAMIFLIVGFWEHDFILGSVMGVAMLSAITVVSLIGSLIPMLTDHLGLDPAVVSGPFITTLSDLMSVLIYFNIASLFIGYFM